MRHEPSKYAQPSALVPRGLRILDAANYTGANPFVIRNSGGTPITTMIHNDQVCEPHASRVHRFRTMPVIMTPALWVALVGIGV